MSRATYLRRVGRHCAACRATLVAPSPPLVPRAERLTITVLAGTFERVELRLSESLVGRLLRPSPIVARALITAGSERVSVKLGCASGAVEASSTDLALALREGREIVRLEDGGYARMAEPGTMAALAGPLREAWDKGVSFHHTDTPRVAQALSPLGQVHVEPGSKALFGRLATAQAPSKPRGLQMDLRPYQQQGLDTLRGWYDLGTGGVLADDMGLGKSGQTIALLTSVRQDTGRLRALVVAPKSVVHNWTNEFRKFAPFVRTHVWEGVNRAKREAEARAAEVVITGYAMVLKDHAFFDTLGLDYVVLDEAQAIKNPHSATAKAAKSLRSDHRLAITGTPVENRLFEFWSLFDRGQVAATRRPLPLAPAQDRGGQRPPR